MLFIDIESFSELDVEEVGAHRYARAAELLLVCWAVDDGPVQVWDAANDNHGDSEARDAFLDAWSDITPRCAHNSDFERLVLGAHYFKSEPEDWDDTMILARTCGLPGKLGTVGKVIGLGEDEAKLKDGKRLVNLFCSPAPKNHKVRRYTALQRPAEWARFIEYCMRDVEVCRRLWRELPHWVYDKERANWLRNQRVGDRGLYVDTSFARAAMAEGDRLTRAANAELAALTGGQVNAVSELPALRTWLAKSQSVCVTSLDKAAITELLEQDLPRPARRALELRQSAGRSSTAKYEAALAGAVDSRVHGTVAFYGASRTGRDAGRLVQPQNMKRPELHGREVEQAREAIREGLVDVLFADPLGALSDCVRGIIAAPPGHKLVVADLSNIEGRMLAWIAGEQWKLDAFLAYDEKRGPDLYRLTYARSFGIRVEAVTDEQRQVGKVEELALGYQGSIGAFNEMGSAYGVRLDDDVVFDIVQKWRMAHPRTVGLWRAVEDAAIAAVRQAGATFKVRDLRFRAATFCGRTWLLVRLPSGRLLCYFDPQIKELTRGRLQLSYVGQVIGGHWARIETYGGKLVENITQAAARDVLKAGEAAAEDAGYPVVLGVHDEVVTEVPDSPDYTVAALCGFLTRPLSWCPGLPLAAKGYEARHYRKD